MVIFGNFLKTKNFLGGAYPRTREYVPPRKFFKMVQFGAFWCIF